MCGGSCDTPRASLGGALVVLRPPPPPQKETTAAKATQGSKPYHTAACYPPSPPLSPGREDASSHEEPPPTESNPRPVPFSGSLVFHNIASSAQSNNSPANMATHVTFTPDTPDRTAATQSPAEEDGGGGRDKTEYTVQIHASGNLLDPAAASPVLHTLHGLLHTHSHSHHQPQSRQQQQQQQQQQQVPQPLLTPLEIGVGGAGIIGRRVTVWRQQRTPPRSPPSPPTTQSALHRTIASPLLPAPDDTRSSSSSRTEKTTTVTEEERVLVAEGIIGFN